MHIISGQFKGRSLTSPKGVSTRPTSSRLRESIFNILQQQIEGARFLDLFAGSGAIGLEALSRGAKSATFIEINPDCIKCIQKNVELLGVGQQSHIFAADAIKTLPRLCKMGHTFDIIYIDPPYSTYIDFEGAKELLSVALVRWVDRLQLMNLQGMLFIEEGIDLSLQDLDLKSLVLNRFKKYGKSYLYEFIHKSGAL